MGIPFHGGAMEDQLEFMEWIPCKIGRFLNNMNGLHSGDQNRTFEKRHWENETKGLVRHFGNSANEGNSEGKVERANYLDSLAWK
jgi:hypothetical protein